MSTFVIVPGAWDTPAVMYPLVASLEAAGHAATVVDLRCDDPEATLEDYAAAARGALPEELADVVLVGYSFGGFTASTIAAEQPDMPMVYIAAWIPRPGVSVLDLFAGADPFADSDEEAGIAAFGGLILSAGPGLCSLNIDRYVSALDPSEQEEARSYLQQTQRPQGSRRCARSGGAGCEAPVPPTSSRPPIRWCPPRASATWRRRPAPRSSRSTPITVPSANSPSASLNC